MPLGLEVIVPEPFFATASVKLAVGGGTGVGAGVGVGVATLVLLMVSLPPSVQAVMSKDRPSSITVGIKENSRRARCSSVVNDTDAMFGIILTSSLVLDRCVVEKILQVLFSIRHRTLRSKRLAYLDQVVGKSDG